MKINRSIWNRLESIFYECDCLELSKSDYHVSRIYALYELIKRNKRFNDSYNINYLDLVEYYIVKNNLEHHENPTNIMKKIEMKPWLTIPFMYSTLLLQHYDFCEIKELYENEELLSHEYDLYRDFTDDTVLKKTISLEIIISRLQKFLSYTFKKNEYLSTICVKQLFKIICTNYYRPNNKYSKEYVNDEVYKQLLDMFNDGRDSIFFTMEDLIKNNTIHMWMDFIKHVRLH